MMISFVLELTTLLCIFYFLLGADFRKSPLKIFFACFITCSCCIFLCFQEFPIPHTFLFMLILFCLFDEKILFTMALTAVATLVEMTAGYACINAIQIFTHIKDSVVYSFLIQIDSCLFLIEILLSLSMHKKRKIPSWDRFKKLWISFYYLSVFHMLYIFGGNFSFCRDRRTEVLFRCTIAFSC